MVFEQKKTDQQLITSSGRLQVISQNYSNITRSSQNLE